MTTYSARTILSKAGKRLKRFGIDQPLLDARLLLAFALELEDAHFSGQDNLLISPPNLATFKMLVLRRCNHEPVSRIIGRRYFWNLDVKLTSVALDPRSDSETLIESLLSEFPNKQNKLKILDLGTGTGCLLLSALSEYPNASGIGIDSSANCVKLAKENAVRNQLKDRAQFQVGDWTKNLSERFDVILCNPPYISTAQISQLEPEVAIHDPMIALNGGQDGLDCYRALSIGLSDVLNQTGKIFLELGTEQTKNVQNIMETAGLTSLKTAIDIGGRERCLVLTN